jgi:DNA-directed RNA polymerase specialized sigma24 family protein
MSSALAEGRSRSGDLFAERYVWLRQRALWLAKRDVCEADALLHDVFVYLSLAGADLRGIHHIDSYLFSVLRRMHLSRVRRTRAAELPLLAAWSYDTADLAWRLADVRTRPVIE